MIKNYFKSNWKDMFSLLFFIVCYATSILLFLGGVQDQTKPSDLEFTTFLPLAIADAVLIFLFIFIEKKVFKTKVNIPLIIILTCLFIVNLIVILTTPLENAFEYINQGSPESILIIISNEDKVMYILCFFMLLLNIYISFNYLVFRVEFKKHFTWICLLCIAVGFLMVIYSYIAEWETYKLFFENIATNLKSFNPQSLTNNSNNYAAILLGAGFCSYGLYAATKKWWFCIIGLFFCANTLFPMSRICLILAVVLTIFMFFYKMIVSWNNHKFRNLNLLFLVIMSLGIFLAMCFTVTGLRDYIQDILFTNNSSFNTRKTFWEIAISLVHGFHCFTGIGHGYFNTVFATIFAGDFKMPHNLYVQTYASLGVLGIILFVCLICFALYKIVLLFKSNREAALISIIGMIILLSYYVTEG